MQDLEFWLCWVKFNHCKFGSKNVPNNTAVKEKFHQLEALREGTWMEKTRLQINCENELLRLSAREKKV